ncbi:restriction endonuclease subunit S [Buttiauxella gaviniae]|uniref:Restriction endonuclease subunit S n=1 Tax=Buttiauxella gaviniae TaxID=82990 RepID=A0ABV3NNX6_9ENTR
MAEAFGNLPDGWVATDLGEYLYLKNGFAFKSNDYVLPSDTTYPVIRISDLDGSVATSEKAVHVQNAPVGFEIIKGDLLIAMSGATTGKLGLFIDKIPALQNQRVGKLMFCAEKYGNITYRNYLLSYLSSDILKIAYGGAQPNISGKAIESLVIPFAPYEEQKVITAKLDVIIALVDSIKTRLDQIPQSLKRFRQAVLSAAVSGRLTADWRGSHTYHSVNLNLSKYNISTSFSTNWKVKVLSDSCSIISGNAFKSTEFNDSDGVPVIKISNVQYGDFEIKNQQFLPLPYLTQFERYQIKPGDVLMALTRPITNDTLKVCRYPEGQPVGVLNQRVCKFSFSNSTEKYFFEVLFQSDYFKVQVSDKLSETLQPNLSPKDLKNLIVVLPGEFEQKEILRRVEKLFAWADNIEKQVAEAQKRVNNLTQSILAKAFRGELTEQWRKDNPDLISGENSAAALLERIKAERAAQTKKPKKKV